MAAFCVFCGSRSGDDPAFSAAARFLGRYLAENGHTTVFGGGSVGLMGVLADSALEYGGHVIGVIPQHLAKVEIMHDRVQDMRVTVDMHERKAAMHALADCYIVLPGGLGTMEELFEAVTWAQLELHARPIVVLNWSGFYDGLLQLIGHMKSHHFLSTRCQALLNIVNSEEELCEWIANQLPALASSSGEVPGN
jgi:uncharacterized protein (TIGR00730 family)